MKLRTHPFNTRPPQEGIALVTVLVLLLLSLTAVLGALRYSNLNEAMLGNTSDYNRTFAAAEALVRDAEIDIRGRLPPYTLQADGSRGTPCRPTAAGSLTTLAGFQGCRNKALANTPFFPLDSSDMDDLETILATNSPTHRCLAGICMPVNSNDLANFETNPVTYAAMIPLGTTYGQFTRNGLTGLAGQVDINPALSNPNSRYWIEAFWYGSSALSHSALPNKKAPFIYRITAIAQGRKEGTRVVIRSIFVPYPQFAQNQ
ncbi:MAG: hypothetical protein RL710_135 [Pseudomonadota bacterium]|jgi:type IV pilus assembly protein PilX